MRGERWVRRALRVEELEPRLVLSQGLGLGGAVVDELAMQDAKAGGADDFGVDAAKAGGAQAVGPAIRLDLVALHEVGHSLGLAHTSDPSSIMYAYYNPGYSVASFANDPAVTGAAANYAGLREIYTAPNSGPWKDSLDPAPGNGVVDVTYSFMPDGTRMESGRSALFTTMNKLFGSASVWQPIFVGAMNLWESASSGLVNFVSHIDTGVPFNYFGLAQNDARSGDIRIGAHGFDGAGRVLAHAYYPPPNGATAAGDMHFDKAENWVVGGSSSSVSVSTVVAAAVRKGKSKAGLAAGELLVGVGPITELLRLESEGRTATAQATTQPAIGSDSRTGGTAASDVVAVLRPEATSRVLHRSGGLVAEEETDSWLDALEMLEYPWDLDWLVMGREGAEPSAAA